MSQEEIKVEEQGTEEQKKKFSGVPMLLVGLLALVAFIIVMAKSGAMSGSDACVIVPQAAFGQSSPQVWTELNSPETAKAVAEFYFEVPEELPVAYEQKIYRVYTKQISEVQCYDGENNEVLRLTKGKMCGGEIYTANKTYNCNNVIAVGDLSVTEMGDDLDTVTIASWVDGEYSYFIGCWDGMPKEEMESLITRIN